MIIEAYSAKVDSITDKRENKREGKHTDHNNCGQVFTDGCSKYIS